MCIKKYSEIKQNFANSKKLRNSLLIHKMFADLRNSLLIHKNSNIVRDLRNSLLIHKMFADSKYDHAFQKMFIKSKKRS